MKRSGSLERAAATEETCDAENAIWPVSIRADHPALDATLDYICSHENVRSPIVTDPPKQRCPGCGAYNRVPQGRLADSPKCGKCHAPIFSAALGQFLDRHAG